MSACPHCHTRLDVEGAPEPAPVMVGGTQTDALELLGGES